MDIKDEKGRRRKRRGEACRELPNKEEEGQTIEINGK